MIFGNKQLRFYLEDAEFVFRDLTKDEFLEFSEIQKSNSLDINKTIDKVNFAFNLLVDVKNAFDADGKALDVESFKKLELTQHFYHTFNKAFTAMVVADLVAPTKAKFDKEKNDELQTA